MKPRLLDLFCGAGGCARGYQRAGFYVIGVDIKPQWFYAGDEFVQADALEVLAFLNDPAPWRHYEDWLPGAKLIHPIAAIHASPPCQAYTKARHLRGNEHPALIAEVRRLLGMTALPYVIENVEAARAHLHDPAMLCGAMFGLRLYRHRLFEMNWPYTPPLHAHHYLRQVKMGRPPNPDEILQPVGHFSDVAAAQAAMEMPWATQSELAEAIPPAYTEHVGHYLMAEVQSSQSGWGKTSDTVGYQP